MPIINIKELVFFAPNIGVIVEEQALERSPEELYKMIQLAWKHMDDEFLRDACHGGGRGPLANYFHLSLEEYLRLKENYEKEQNSRRVTAGAKKEHTLKRRAEFNSKRSQLILAMIDSGIPYICSHTECEEHADLTVDHIVPLSKGGHDELSNLRFLCRQHNSVKGDKPVPKSMLNPDRE